MHNLEIELLSKAERERDWLSQRYLDGAKRTIRPVSRELLDKWERSFSHTGKDFPILKGRVFVPESWGMTNILAAFAVAGANLVSKRMRYENSSGSRPKVSLIIDEEDVYSNKIGFHVQRDNHLYEGALYLPGFGGTGKIAGIPSFVQERGVTEITIFDNQFFEKEFSTLSPSGAELLNDVKGMIE